MSLPYKIINSKGKKVPILLSVPHVGMDFPASVKDHFKAALIKNPDDTDFFVEKLYDFAPEMGITMIHATYSRWLIDLNRSPENKALYSDGRIITNLTPTTNFLGEAIYKNADYEPDSAEVEKRKELYFYPYYQKITSLLADLKSEFGQVLLWDAHSIRRSVPSIQKAPFPDLILGNNDEQSAAKALIEISLNGLKESGFEVTHNQPFKGGNITRHFGKPATNIHALQLEMTKDLYMDDTELEYHPQRAAKIRKMLQAIFEKLIIELK
jgi:N-formylglutamate amidohydrolase